MTVEELKKALYKISIGFVKNNNTMIGAYTYQTLISDLYLSALRRHIIGDLQLFETNIVKYDDYEIIEATFQFSPNYLNREPAMLYAGMRYLKWTLLLNEYIDRTDNELLENDEEGIEEEIIGCITNAQIEIVDCEDIEAIDYNEFIESLS